MKAERFVVSTTVRGITRSKIWDSAKPTPVDINQTWLLERSGEKMRVRTYNNQVAYDVNQDSEVNLPHELKLRVVPINTVSPPYHLPEGAKGVEDKDLQLLAFSGVGRGIISCQPVHTAYVAYTRKQPVFTLYRGEDGIKIKPLLDGVKFKLRKQPPIAGPVGEEWSITPEQLYGASVIRGSHWWRFNLVPVNEVLQDGPDAEELREGESVGLKRGITILLLMLLMFGAAVYFAPRPDTKKNEEIKEAPIVKFIAPPKPKEMRKITPPVAEPPKKIEKKVVEEEAPPKPDPVVQEKKKPEPVKVKNEDHEKSTKKAPAKPKEAPESKVAKPVSAPPKESHAAAQAAEKLRMLRSALGGATHLAQSTVGKATPTGKAAEMFSGGASSPVTGTTQIKPSYSGDNTKVTGVGGSYTKGEHAAVSAGKSSSFVSVDSGGPTVEEGLRKEEVGAVIHKHTDEVRYCHETAMLYHPNLEGKVVVKFSISPAGVVEKASIESSTLPDKTLEECILKRLVTWKFPHPKGGVHVSVSYPFLFKTLGGE